MKRSFFDALTANPVDSITITDFEGKYLAVSQKKADNWGLERQKMIGLTDFDLMTPEEAAISWDLSLQVIQTGEPIKDSIQRVVRNDREVYYSVSKYMTKCDIGNEETPVIVSISRDITKRIEIEQRNNAMLMQIIDMIKMVSHDMSSPLISISSQVKLIMRTNFGPVSDSVLAALDGVHKRLLKQRRAVLDYLHKFSSLDENQQIEKELLDLRADIIDEVLFEIEELIEDNRSKIDASLGLIPIGAVIVFSCKEQLKIVYRNLIVNALKHGGEGCIIALGFEEYANYFQPNVWNNGPAVPENEIANLFEPFMQGKNAPKGSGLGIGLHTVRKMIRNLGGDMWYETTRGNNPNFLFTIMKRCE